MDPKIIDIFRELAQEIKKQTLEIRELVNTIKADRAIELTVEEAAAFCKVSPKTIHNLVSSGKLVGFKKRRRRMFLKSELQEFIKS